MRLGRSTLYGWLDGIARLFAPLLAAMLSDARAAPYICIDATGVLVQRPSNARAGISGCSWCLGGMSSSPSARLMTARRSISCSAAMRATS